MKNNNIEIQTTNVVPTESAAYPNIYTAIPPNKKTCPYTGLKHAQLYKLLTGEGQLRGHVRVAHLTLPGVTRGKTLFHVGDLLRFLDGLADQQGSGKIKEPGRKEFFRNTLLAITGSEAPLNPTTPE